MKIFIASDHAGFQEKEALIKDLRSLFPRYSWVDLGPNSPESTSYSQYALTLVKHLAPELPQGSLGILVCGSGIGMSMAANRFKGIRAALCRSSEEAKLSREHNNANVLCLGARITPLPLMKQMVQVWLETPFAGGRHQDRVKLMDQWGSDASQIP